MTTKTRKGVAIVHEEAGDYFGGYDTRESVISGLEEPFESDLDRFDDLPMREATQKVAGIKGVWDFGFRFPPRIKKQWKGQKTRRPKKQQKNSIDKDDPLDRLSFYIYCSLSNSC